MTLSFAAGPLIGGVLTDLFGWRSVLAVNVVVAVPLLFGLRAVRAEPPADASARID